MLIVFNFQQYSPYKDLYYQNRAKHVSDYTKQHMFKLKPYEHINISTNETAKQHMFKFENII